MPENMASRRRARKQRAASRKRKASEYNTDTEHLFPIWDSEKAMHFDFIRLGGVIIRVISNLVFRRYW